MQIYIEGDNLEVLKLLQETNLGKIKMIYIDPPYNTGSDLGVQIDTSKICGGGTKKHTVGENHCFCFEYKYSASEK